MPALLLMIPKVLMNLGISLMSEALIEELLLWSLSKLAKHTKTKVDDELLAMAKKHLGK